MNYDGSGKLAEAIAELYGLSPKSQARIADLMKQAKEALGVTSKAKQLPDDIKLAIYQWHYDKLNSVQNIKRNDVVYDVKQEIPFNGVDGVVYDVKQTDALEIIVQNVKQEIELDSDGDIVQNIKQDNSESDAGAVYDFKQIHFAVTIEHLGKPKRTTIMLEGYLVKALQRKHGLVDNAAIRLWIEQAIKSDSVRFDSYAALTRQVKRLIIESLCI